MYGIGFLTRMSRRRSLETICHAKTRRFMSPHCRGAKDRSRQSLTVDRWFGTSSNNSPARYSDDRFAHRTCVKLASATGKSRQNIKALLRLSQQEDIPRTRGKNGEDGRTWSLPAIAILTKVSS